MKEIISIANETEIFPINKNQFETAAKQIDNPSSDEAIITKNKNTVQTPKEIASLIWRQWVLCAILSEQQL